MILRGELITLQEAIDKKMLGVGGATTQPLYCYAFFKNNTRLLEVFVHIRNSSKTSAKKFYRNSPSKPRRHAVFRKAYLSKRQRINDNFYTVS